MALVRRLSKRQTRVIDALSDHVGIWLTEATVCDLADVSRYTLALLAVKLARPSAADFPYDLQSLVTAHVCDESGCPYGIDKVVVCYRLVRRRRYGVGPRYRRRTLLPTLWQLPSGIRVLPSGL